MPVQTVGRLTVRERVPRARTAIPRLSDGHVRRPRLRERLDSAEDGQVVLVTAPAGYGKTSLLTDWANDRPDDTAWVAVTPDDNDDRRFWSAVLDAVTGLPAVPVSSGLHTLAVPASPSADADFLAQVADGLDALPTHIVLVLDDVHELVAAAPVHGMATLVRDRPPGLRIVLSGRSDPPLPLARLRAADQLCVVRAEHLRFTVDEAGAMLGATADDLGAGLVAALTEYTGGWAAGLLLAAPTLRSAEDPQRFLDDLIDGGRALSDYLVDEIMQRMEPSERALVEAVSLCTEITAPLAEALSERADAGEVLDRIERATGLIVSSGPGRTRYALQPLLRTHLQVELRRRRPDVVADLHGRAAQWFAARRRPGEALRHAVRAGDPAALIDLLRRDGVDLLGDGAYAGLREAAAQLIGRTADDPWLALLAALAHLEVGDLDRTDHHLAEAAASWPADAPADLTALRRLARARRLPLGPPPADGPDDADTRETDPAGLAPFLLVESGYAALAERRTDVAVDLAVAARELARDHPHPTAECDTLLALVAAYRGDYPLMAALAERADAARPGPQAASSRQAARTAILRAYRALLLADPDQSLALAQPAVTFAGEVGLGIPTQSTAVLTAIRGAAAVDSGNPLAGLTLLEEARGGLRSPGRGAALVALLEHRAAAGLGYTDRARACLAWATDAVGDDTGDIALLRAHHQFQLGRTIAAATLLAPLLDGSAPPLVPWAVPEGWVLACRLGLRADRPGEARAALQRAVDTSAALDVLRPLATASVEVIDMLGRSGTMDGVVARALDARRLLAGRLPVALTERERAVLGLLLTQRSVAEIADDLMVSANTVKTHLRAIYAKLGVRKRREAIRIARARHLPGP